MPPLIQRIAISAFKTFSRLKVTPQATPELKELTELVRLLTADDINFDYDIIREKSESETKSSNPNLLNNLSNDRRAPVVYIHLWEDTVYSMGIFVLRPGAFLPLHDHPCMYGMLKVLFGTCSIENYTLNSTLKPPQSVVSSLKLWQKNNVICANKFEEPTVHAYESGPCLLTPSESNLHEIRAINGPMAFLDILAPPYDHATGARECHYYKNLTKELGCFTEPSVLMEIPQPREFWCESAEYIGPKIDPYENGIWAIFMKIRQ